MRANLYPMALQEPFYYHFLGVWLPDKSETFFAKRDPKALQYLPYLLPKPDAA